MSVDLSVSDHVATVTLNRPEKMNALNTAMQHALAKIWLHVRERADIRVVILTGAGNEAFCAGFDLKEMGEIAAAQVTDPGADPFWMQTSSGALETDLNIRKPIIAAIEGYCFGAGLTLALSCDMRIASEQARFGYPEAKWGISTVAGSLRLPQVASLGIAMEMLLVGDAIDAPRAYQVGMLNRLVPAGTALAQAQELAARLSHNAPLAVYATKELILRGLTLPFDDAFRLGEALRRAVRQSEDFAEGMASFRDKRPANFRGH